VTDSHFGADQTVEMNTVYVYIVHGVGQAAINLAHSRSIEHPNEGLNVVRLEPAAQLFECIPQKRRQYAGDTQGIATVRFVNRYLSLTV